MRSDSLAVATTTQALTILHQTARAHPPALPADTLTQAVCDALRQVIGTYGLAVICTDFPDTIIAARRGSPIIIGIGQDENFIASDANAIVAHTKKVVYLDDYDVATVTAGTILTW